MMPGKAVNQIAQVCHEANRAWCEVTGDLSQKLWDDAEPWQRESAWDGVRFALSHPDAPASAQHEAWSADKRAQGWVYGERKDGVSKTHPCLVPFEQLPLEQQLKDVLFKAIVDALRPLEWNEK